jgi:hypothetical protein
MSEPANARKRRKPILVALVLLVLAAGFWWVLSTKASNGVTIRFVGYTEGKPYAALRPEGSQTAVAINGRGVTTDDTLRVAQFVISNRNNFPVSCQLMLSGRVRGEEFIPSHHRVAAHTTTNVVGVIVSGGVVNYPSSADWTKPWRLTVWAGEATPLGIRARREEATLWLYRHKWLRLGRWMDPRRIQQIETELIPPDSGAKR